MNAPGGFERDRVEEEIRDLLSSYERSLNESDAGLAVSCYGHEGMFMAPGLPTASGGELLAAYEAIFERIRLRVTFAIDEIEIASPTVAFALTRSHGTQTVLATGTESVESNREMFIFKPDGARAWKIARYLFNKLQ